MKDVTFDARIVAAARPSEHTNTFVKETMKHIKRSSLAAGMPARQGGFAYWLRHLSKPMAAVLALVVITLVGGAVYAAVQFAPALIQLLGKETNQRGATEYSVGGFTECSTTNNPAGRFEVALDAPALSDEDVRKIVQARCETQWLQQFPSKQWPTYGTNAEWKDGDTIYYARLDMIGTANSATEASADIVLGDRAVTHTPPHGEKIKAFAAGQEIPLSDIKPGDTVFTISRVSQKYYAPKPAATKAESFANHPQDQPKTEGVIGLFKLSLPIAYYHEMQQYVTEIPECFGNKGELCPNTPSIDVYPAGSEGATNPYLQQVADGVSREISGTVTELSGSKLTLKTRSGTLFTVTVADDGFTVYNRDIAGNHTDLDAALKPGSTVMVWYHQPKDADARQVTPEQIWRVSLQLEGARPKKSVKQY